MTTYFYCSDRLWGRGRHSQSSWERRSRH